MNPLLYRILAGLSSSGKLVGREVKTSALVSRRSWVRIPPESPVKFFSTDTRKALGIQCYTHVGVRAKLNQLFITRRKNFINLSICTSWQSNDTSSVDCYKSSYFLVFVTGHDGFALVLQLRVPRCCQVTLRPWSVPQPHGVFWGAPDPTGLCPAEWAPPRGPVHDRARGTVYHGDTRHCRRQGPGLLQGLPRPQDIRGSEEVADEARATPQGRRQVSSADKSVACTVSPSSGENVPVACPAVRALSAESEHFAYASSTYAIVLRVYNSDYYWPETAC